ncbi:hypothetical protein V5410_000171 [Klebsiella oxytoca]
MLAVAVYCVTVKSFYENYICN